MDTNRSSGPFHSEITERVLSPDLAGSDSIYQVFKTQLLFRNTRWHFNGERGCNERGTFNKHIYYHYTCIQGIISTTTDYKQLSMYSHLNSFTCRDSAPHHSHKETRKDPLTDKGVRRGPWAFITRGLGDRKGPTRPLQVTCTLVVP